MRTNHPRSGSRAQAGFTIAEVVVAAVVLGLASVSIYAGFTIGANSIRFSREQLRATQILMQKVEYVRLLSWDQITGGDYDPDELDLEMTNDPEHLPGTIEVETPFILPRTFTEYFTPGGNGAPGDVVYTGKMIVTNAPVSETYSNALKLVIIDVRWTSGGTTRTQRVQTLFSRYGMQNSIPRDE